MEHCLNMFEMKEKRSKSVQSRTMCHQLAVTMHFLEIVLDNKAILGRGRGSMVVRDVPLSLFCLTVVPALLCFWYQVVIENRKKALNLKSKGIVRIK